MVVDSVLHDAVWYLPMRLLNYLLGPWRLRECDKTASVPCWLIAAAPKLLTHCDQQQGSWWLSQLWPWDASVPRSSTSATLSASRIPLSFLVGGLVASVMSWPEELCPVVWSLPGQLQTQMCFGKGKNRAGCLQQSGLRWQQQNTTHKSSSFPGLSGSPDLTPSSHCMAWWSNPGLPEEGEDATRSAWCRPGLGWMACPSWPISMTQGHWEHYPWLPSFHLVPWVLLSLLRLRFTILSWNGEFTPFTMEESCNWTHAPERKMEKERRVDMKTFLDLAVCSTSLLHQRLKTALSGSSYTKGTVLAQWLPRSGTNTLLLAAKIKVG